MEEMTPVVPSSGDSVSQELLPVEGARCRRPPASRAAPLQWDKGAFVETGFSSLI